MRFTRLATGQTRSLEEEVRALLPDAAVCYVSTATGVGGFWKCAGEISSRPSSARRPCGPLFATGVGAIGLLARARNRDGQRRCPNIRTIVVFVRIVAAVADVASQLVHRCDGDRIVFLETSIRTARRLSAASMLSMYRLYIQRPLSRRRHTAPQTRRPVIDRLGIVTVQMCQP